MIEESGSTENQNPYATSDVGRVEASVTPAQRPPNISTLAVAAIVFACLLMMLVTLVMAFGFVGVVWLSIATTVAAVIGPLIAGWLMIEMLRRR